MIRSILLAFAVGAAAVAAAQDVITRTYPLPKHGQFELKVPASWNDTVQQPPNDVPPTINFQAKSGAPFQIFVTPVWKRRPDMKAPAPDEIKSFIEHAAEEATKLAVEKVVPVKELKGTSGRGYYYTATDKAPKGEEFKYIAQGMLQVGDLIVNFTILTNDGQESVAKDALDMLSGAQHRAQ